MASSRHGEVPIRLNLLEWLRTRDAGLSALRRSARAAIVMPTVFAIADLVIGRPTLAIFTAFGSVAMLLFVDFTGSMRERLAAQASLVLVGAVLVTIGTLVSEVVWLAVVTTLVVAFAVLFAGVVSSVLASATTALLLGFILPLSLPGPVGSIPDRLYGWLFAGAASLVAIATMWPAPTRDQLRRSTAEACALLARRLAAEVDCVRDDFGPERTAALRELSDQTASVVGALSSSFYGAPYRPTGLTTAARALVRLTDQVAWLDALLRRAPVDRRPGPNDQVVCDVELAAAGLLERGAALLDSEDGDPRELDPALERLQAARETMERKVTATLPVHRVPAAAGDGSGGEVAEFVSALEPSFRAEELSFATSAIAANIALHVAARRRSWWQRLLGRRPEGVASPLASAQERAGAHVERHSVWLHNSVRGAIGLSLAVLVAKETGVHNSFWVVLGTLAVLRSSALNTGQNALRALLGTVAGFVVGGGVVYAVGSNTTVFWLLLPLAVAFTGLAPATISFAVGQAAFTATLLILYNIIGPAGWQIGLVRIEDVAIGSAVSLVVGALFWPRGAASALGQALAEGFSDSARYLHSAIDYGVTRCDAMVASSPAPGEERRRAAAAARRLDDAFREFLAERGTKHVAMADVTTLLTAVAVLRLTADAILDLWSGADHARSGDRTAARAELLGSGGRLVEWYQQVARALVGAATVPEPLPHDKAADGRLIDAVRRDLYGEDGRGTATAVKMIWTAEHLDAARRLQPAVLEPAREVAAVRRTPRSWLSGRRQEPSHVAGFSAGQ
ncbi:MAG TPA: FUSC family protein [Actinomycetes bacterium]